MINESKWLTIVKRINEIVRELNRGREKLHYRYITHVYTHVYIYEKINSLNCNYIIKEDEVYFISVKYIIDILLGLMTK